MESSNESKNKWYNTMILFAVVSSATLLLVNIFRWDIVEIVTPFLQPILEIIVLVFFACVSIAAVLNGFAKFKVKKFYSLVPFLICFLTFIIVFFVPIDSIMLDLNFKYHYNGRMQVINMIETDQIKIDTKYDECLIELPEKYKHLSRGGGEVVVSIKEGTISVLFYTFRGTLDNFAGFIYKSDNNEPSQTDFNGNYHEIKKFSERWFWATSW